MRRFFMLVVALGVSLVPLRALADAVSGLTPDGAGVDTGSWTQKFKETRTKAFDSIVVLMVGGNDFESPAFRIFSDPSWELSKEITSAHPRLAVASGNHTRSLQFDLTFASAPNTKPPFTFWLGAFDDEKPVEFARARWSGSSWDICSLGLQPLKSDLLAAGLAGAEVPLPDTAWMGFALLAAMGSYSFWRKSRNA